MSDGNTLGTRLAGFFGSLVHRKETPREQARPGAPERVTFQPGWRPDLLIPVENPKNWDGPLILLRSMVYPSGSIQAFTVAPAESGEVIRTLDELVAPLREKDIRLATTVVEGRDFAQAAQHAIRFPSSGSILPNTLFLIVGEDERRDPDTRALAEAARDGQLGLIILYQYPRTAFGVQKDISLWLRDESPNWRLASLIAMLLQANWHGNLNIITVAPTREESRRLYQFHEHLGERLSQSAAVEFLVMAGDFRDALTRAPRADINIYGLSDDISFDAMRAISRTTKASCLFIRDSGMNASGE